ncbi:hypothetical protein KP509_20G042200 [Ceratopteris richardii]|uniref:Secreted protein n=1 Tax=Ceratopteris richardii TaxID=49495 RepID=A0A8T2SI22_CERRI|nr:hypothetical protein KP509_20G042200 [Ceratopteris richardii]
MMFPKPGLLSVFRLSWILYHFGLCVDHTNDHYSVMYQQLWNRQRKMGSHGRRKSLLKWASTQ